MTQSQARGVAVAQPNGGKVALPMTSVRKVIEDLPELDLAQIEEVVGHRLDDRFKLEYRAERNVVGAIIAAVNNFSKKGINLAGAGKEERLAALYGFSLIRSRVQELFATRQNQVTGGGTFVFNFPLFMGHPMCGVLKEMLENASRAYPDEAARKIPPYEIRWLGVVPGMGGGHSQKFLPQGNTQGQAEGGGAKSEKK